MIKELKQVLFLLIIFLFIFFTIKYYFSDNNEKNYYRSLKLINQKIKNYSNQLIVLKNNTDNIIEYVDNNSNKKQKKYNFWNLIKK